MPEDHMMISRLPVTPVAAGASQPTILVFGDSHSDAVRRAVIRRLQEGRPSSIAVFRTIKHKNGQTFGDVSFEDFVRRISDLGPNDVVVSMIGGSQYALISTAQHPIPFDFHMPGQGTPSNRAAAIIPFRTLHAFLGQCINNDVPLDSGGTIKGDRRKLEALQAATRAKVMHVIPPPPLYDSERIARRHERWVAEGIGRFGVAPADLRLKFWSLQARVLQDLCGELGVEVIMPVEEATQDGFLRPAYHQGGAHANEAYGELVLRSLEARFLRPAAAA